MTPLKDLARIERCFADATTSVGVLPLRYTRYDHEHPAHWSTIRYGGGAIALAVPHKVQLENQANAIVELVNSTASLLADACALRELVAALPKCSAVGCDRPATSETDYLFCCDEHPESTAEELPTAAVTRRLGL